MISADFKQKIHGKKPLKGTFVKMNCPTAVEALGLAGLDFIIIDGEHAPLDEMHLEAMLRAADCVGLPVVVRVPVADEFHILKVLDMGAAGVQIPGLTSTEEVRACLDAALYAPEGHRGLSFSQRSARYGTMDKFEYMRHSNENLVKVFHIENREIAARVEELCQVRDIDVLFVGPMDLSQSFGHPGNPANPEEQDAIRRIIEVAARYDVPVGIFVGTAEAAAKYEAMGVRYIAIGSDISFLMNGAKSAMK